MASAINRLPSGIRGNKQAVAETIANNVRSKIIKEHLNDPAYYEKMSALLDEIIAARKAKAIEYEEYLKRIADLARKVEAGMADDAPEPLKRSPGLRAVYNNLRMAPGANVAGEPGGKYDAGKDEKLALALRIDETVKRARPDGWRGVQPREQVIKAELYRILKDEAEVERIILVIKAQAEY
jgi:type I restriction enzyme R subunit